MRFTYKDPITENEIELTAEPEDYNGEQGFRIIFPEKDSFVMVQKDGSWEVVDDDDINPAIVEAIAAGLKSPTR
ncbi:hypothetical protein GCM10011387_04120 [Pedobacter quisquiliarum]|jgi:hypothetical protein|uniref:Uncharacterized protein n=1 Tax=Pedobacter quisquiliarum TaxID=1834438 RepID=A0A916X9K1_9SPHI|nr:hypothetical protein [Pedobacter quisquiliarum]GGC53736.1 hypothetical protein GCM10011387_04120 [Pedobacter quisquiliarum]